MVKALIFDLDNCLAAANEVGEQLFEPMFDAIRQANHGHIPEAALDAAFHDCWYHALDWVAKKHGFNSAMLDAGWRSLSQIEVTQPMHGYGDLHLLSELPAALFLVTAGFRRLQQSKINALNFTRYFSAVYIDAIDDQERFGKLGIFEKILRQYGLDPAEVLVIGDNPDSELAAGKQLGIRTVQILRPGVLASELASFQVQGLADLPPLLSQL